MPDLTITSIALNNYDPCKPGVPIRVTVANIGNANAGSFVVAAQNVAMNNMPTQTISGLAAGQSTFADFILGGFGTLQAIADTTLGVTESNETNNSMTVTIPPLGMPCAPSATPSPIRTGTATPSTKTPTRTSTIGTTGSLSVQLRNGGTDNSQQTQFAYIVRNTGSSTVSGVSVRIYFTLDGSNAASNYVLEKYYDQSGVAAFSAPILVSGSTYYIQVNYGTASLGAGAQWELQTSLHLANWGSTFSGGNDWFHTGYAVGALPANYTSTNYVPAYVNGTLAWGITP